MVPPSTGCPSSVTDPSRVVPPEQPDSITRSESGRNRPRQVIRSMVSRSLRWEEGGPGRHDPTRTLISGRGNPFPFDSRTGAFGPGLWEERTDTTSGRFDQGRVTG